jgi:hypothetical protein
MFTWSEQNTPNPDFQALAGQMDEHRLFGLLLLGIR